MKTLSIYPLIFLAASILFISCRQETQMVPVDKKWGMKADLNGHRCLSREYNPESVPAALYEIGESSYHFSMRKELTDTENKSPLVLFFDMVGDAPLEEGTVYPVGKAGIRIFLSYPQRSSGIIALNGSICFNSIVNTQEIEAVFDLEGVDGEGTRYVLKDGFFHLLCKIWYIW